MILGGSFLICLIYLAVVGYAAVKGLETATAPFREEYDWVIASRLAGLLAGMLSLVVIFFLGGMLVTLVLLFLGRHCPDCFL